MKKFFILLLIIIALAGTAFFFGWANFSVPPGSYGVITSKTHGTDPEIIQAGEFRWIWYKLIPTNAHISTFRLEQKQFPVDFNSSLPSGDTYSQFLGLNNIDFSWEIKGQISFSINPSELINITVKNALSNQDDLDKYMRDTADKIRLVILRHFGEATPEELERLLSGITTPALEQAVKRTAPEIRDFILTINSAKYPDFLLYREIRIIYEEFLAKQREFITSSFGQRAESHIQSQLHFAELEQYGELLTKYPILLDFLALEKASN